MSVTMESQDRDMAEEFWDDLMNGELSCGVLEALAWKFSKHRQDTEARVRAEYPGTPEAVSALLNEIKGYREHIHGKGCAGGPRAECIGNCDFIHICAALAALKK